MEAGSGLFASKVQGLEGLGFRVQNFVPAYLRAGIQKSAKDATLSLIMPSLSETGVDSGRLPLLDPCPPEP